MRLSGLVAIGFWTLIGILGSFSRTTAEDRPSDLPSDYKLLYTQDFSQATALDDFQMTDAHAWKLAARTNSDRPALELVRLSKYVPPYDSPLNIALLRNWVFGDCVIDVDCLQTGKEYGHRDMIFVFGYQSPAQYYYTHIATAADDHANQIFIVDKAPRKKISQQTNAGNQWGLNEWRHVRIARNVSSGSIKVYFEDMAKPVMVAEDKTFGDGWVGFGSFDDTGKISNIKIWGKTAERKDAPAFPAN